MSSGIQSIERLLCAKSLEHLMDTLRDQNQFLDSVRRMLPPPVDKHCIAAIRNGQRATVYADSPVWASRMRFLTRKIIQHLKLEGHPVKELKIRILIPESAPARRDRTPARRAVLSTASADIISAVADDLSDPQLKAVLKRISEKAR